mmetsp:Transcript_21400/g.61035  ORF Transcript_21400/g.61035 Transcript_21400/m.61035 type:complete len:218 (-) Transcript_21400:576-1229(-)
MSKLRAEDTTHRNARISNTCAPGATCERFHEARVVAEAYGALGSWSGVPLLSSASATLPKHASRWSINSSSRPWWVYRPTPKDEFKLSRIRSSSDAVLLWMTTWGPNPCALRRAAITSRPRLPRCPSLAMQTSKAWAATARTPSSAVSTCTTPRFPNKRKSRGSKLSTSAASVGGQNKSAARGAKGATRAVATGPTKLEGAVCATRTSQTTPGCVKL